MVTVRQFKSIIISIIAILAFVVYGFNPLTVVLAVVALGIFVWSSVKDYTAYKAFKASTENH